MKPELCAPAGSIESFHAAVEAGADAVYLGLTDFNARLRAKNFTPKTLSYLVPYAHRRNVKLYVTLNTLVKEAELKPVIHALYQCEQIGVDALIVADRGVIDIARRYFPRLRLHASTQMAVHNAAGARAALRLGLKRAVLSRECTLDEVRTIKKTTAEELEAFVHGALCYSISGLCLASSYLGGSSGNRGRCTQVCRRKFFSGTGKGGCYFSPNDLCAVSRLPELVSAGVDALKIEGRMKNAAYVFTVVSAYRKAIDAQINVEEAQKLLADDLGREKTTLVLDGMRSPGIISASARSGVGEPVGTVTATGGGTVVIAPSSIKGSALFAGDRIRIQPESGFEGAAADILALSIADGRLCLTLKAAAACSPGDTVFLVGRHCDRARFDRRGVEGVEPVRFSARCPFVNNIIPSSPRRTLPPRRDSLWVRIDTAGWLELLVDSPCQHLIFSGSSGELENLLHDEQTLKTWRSRLYVAPPPFVPEQETAGWCRLLERCAGRGIRKGVCSNIGNSELFPMGFELVADGALGCLNRASQDALGKIGFTMFVYPYEDDFLNMKACNSQRGIAGLFAHVPLFISRIRSAVRTGTEVADPHGNRFVSAEAYKLFYLLSKTPFSITHRRRKLSEVGIHEFLFDLSFCAPDPVFLKSLLDSYKNGTRLPASSLFNFKAGLR
jgi:U32 family peptidase